MDERDERDAMDERDEDVTRIEAIVSIRLYNKT